MWVGSEVNVSIKEIGVHGRGRNVVTVDRYTHYEYA